MAIKIVDRVWKGGRHSGITLLVLLAIADCANKVTGECFPSQQTLAKKCRANRRSIQRAIQELVEYKDIEIVQRGGAMKGDRYEHAIYRMGQMYSRDGIIPPLIKLRGDKSNKQGAASDRPNRQENRKEEACEEVDEQTNPVEELEYG